MITKKSIYLVIYTVFILSLPTSAQNFLKGEIRDIKDSTPLAGVTIYIAEFKIAGGTDDKGKFSIRNIPEGIHLVEVRLIGYAGQTREIEIDGETIYNFYLQSSNIDFGEVVVTGVSSATEEKTNPIPMNVVTQKAMLQSSATNIIDALARTPGVSQITEGPAISKPMVRGLGYNRVVVMNDGIRQEGNQWGDEFGIEIDEYSVYKTEILKGPASLAYGSDAMAGVINMISAPVLPEGKIRGNLITNYQSNNGLFATSANVAGNIKGITFDFRYTNKMAHAYQNSNDGYVWNSGYSEQSAKGIIGINRRWGYSRITLSSFDLQLGIIEGNRDTLNTGKFTMHQLINGKDSSVIAPANLYTQYNSFPIIHQHVRHHKIVFDNNFAIGESHLKLTLGWQQNYRQESNNITAGDFYNNSFFLNTMNYNLQFVLPEIKKLEVSIGVNGMLQNSQDKGVVYLVPEYNLFDFGGFATGKKTIGKFSVSGGIRYQLRNLQGMDMFTDSTGNRVTSSSAGNLHRFTAYSSNFTGVAGSIGGTYEISKNLYAKANISRGFRAPNIAESGSNGIHDGTPFYEIGDPNLKPESSNQVDLTIGANTENFTFQLNAFYNDISNYIFPEKLRSTHGGDSLRFDPNSGLPGGPTFKYVSGNAVLSGGEIVLNIHPKAIRWVRLDNSFSMVNAIQKNQPDSTKYLPYTPPYKLITQITFQLWSKSKIFKNAYIKAGMDYYFKQDNVFYKYGNETPTVDYGLLNAGFGGDCVRRGKTICSLYVFGSDLTNLAYQSNMSRLKYTMYNPANGRIGVYNMGRNISIKLLIPLDFR